MFFFLFKYTFETNIYKLGERNSNNDGKAAKKHLQMGEGTTKPVGVAGIEQNKTAIAFILQLIQIFLKFERFLIWLILPGNLLDNT